ERDLQVEKMHKRYASKLATLQDRIRRAEQGVEREKSQATQQTFQTALSIGQTVLGALFGRKVASRTNLGRATTSVRSAGRIAKERGDVERATETVETLARQLEDLEA